MAINPVDEKLHRIRVKLYPNYLPGTTGKYIARTDDEASLSVGGKPSPRWGEGLKPERRDY